MIYRGGTDRRKNIVLVNGNLEVTARFRDAKGAGDHVGTARNAVYGAIKKKRLFDGCKLMYEDDWILTTSFMKD